MTQYFGGKSRLGQSIAAEILSHQLYSGQPYFEPFMGMASVLRHVVGADLQNNGDSVPRGRWVVGNDFHPDLVAMWFAIQRGWTPPQQITQQIHDGLKEEYRACLDEKRCLRNTWYDTSNYDVVDTRLLHRAALRSFVGFGCSHSALYFHTFRPEKITAALNALEKSRQFIQQVQLWNLSYQSFQPSGFLIYCDPPYCRPSVDQIHNNRIITNNNDTHNLNNNEYCLTNEQQKRKMIWNRYEGTPMFDGDEFWNIMRDWSMRNTVLISERYAPSDFVSVWQGQQIQRVAARKDSQLPTDSEHLFMYRYGMMPSESGCNVLTESAKLFEANAASILFNHVPFVSTRFLPT